MRAWRRFESALRAPREQQAEELRAVLRDLDAAPEGSDEDRIELRAASVSALARLDAASLDEAKSLALQAVQRGRSGWPNYYLAQAAGSVGAPELALEALSAIPENFFDAQDLHWRAVQCLEIDVLARLSLGDLRSARNSLLVWAREYASEATDEFLASPRHLVRELLHRDGGLELLGALKEVMDLPYWLPAELNSDVNAALS